MVSGTLQRALQNYNSIYNSTKADFRIECKANMPYDFFCTALDHIQLCAYCMMKMTDQEFNEVSGRYDLIQWKAKKCDDEYIFYPVLTADLEKEMISMHAAPCPDVQPYLPKKDPKQAGDSDFQCYKTCVSQEEERDIVSTDIETDIFFYMIRKKRSLDELKFLSKLLCSINLEIMHKFCKDMITEIKCKPTMVERKKLQKATLDFISSAEKMNKAIKERNFNEFAEIKEASQIIADILNSRRSHEKVVLNEYASDSFDAKCGRFFSTGKKWGLNKYLRNKRCEDYINEIKRLT